MRLSPRAATLITIIAPLLIAAAVPATAAVGGSASFASDLEEAMPGLLARYGVPGSVVACIEDGEVASTSAFGVADARTGEPMQPHALFEHGSNGKALTAWAVMRLVEAGRVALDEPANRYLERWKITADRFDADGVTVRQLLSHTSGLNIHGYLDYSMRRVRLPDLARVLRGAHLFEGLNEALSGGSLSLGRAALVGQPGSSFRYSGAGYAALQMIVEDVSGEAFAAFVQRTVTDPLGATGIRWAWTDELRATAATPHGNEGQALEFRQLAAQGIGSEIATVADFARFVAAAVAGPRGETAGRGVLAPETIAMMTSAQPGAGGGYGLGFGLATNYGEPAINHSGANSGWVAFYFLDLVRRDGFVVASNSSRAGPLHGAILGVWSDALFGPATRQVPPPAPRWDALALGTFALAAVAGLVLLVFVGRFVRQLVKGCRRWTSRPAVGTLLSGLPWLAWLLFVAWTVYSPLPLYLPAWFPDFWPSPAVAVLAAVLAAWVVFRLIVAWFPRGLAATRVLHASCAREVVE